MWTYFNSLKIFDRKSFCRTVRNEIMSNKELGEELHEPVIRAFEKRKVHSSFIEITCGTDLENMQLISKFKK